MDDMDYKPVLVPEIMYDAIKYYSRCHGYTMKESMKQLFMAWTLDFWMNPGRYDCYPNKIRK